MESFEKVSIKGQIIKGCEFGYKYEVGNDSNGIEYGAYRISTCTESRGIISRGNLKDENVKESFYINDLGKIGIIKKDFKKEGILNYNGKDNKKYNIEKL
ncbi:MAG: hypothetical protein Q9M97_07805 [Candidatus Gracilibacteria bacterium]|nr:hypothetical protein [Candidatus Gracilibacteria bacterium]